MTRRRLAAVALVAALAGGLGSAQVATAEPARQPVDLSGPRGDYWACLALDQVNVGTCLENPLPDPSSLPSLEDLLGIVLAR